MSFAFKRAIRENVGLLIGLAGASGSGKTFTAFRLATGICGDKPFAVIDTESRRALHYADDFKFDHLEIGAPFRPETYLDAIVAADKAGYPVIVVDSMSHEHAGDGGLLDWHDELLDEFVDRAQKTPDRRSEWQIRDANNMRAWIKPKMAHKKMVMRLLQSRAHLILCFRAEEKVEIGKDEKGKTKIVPKQSIVGLNGWMPVCEKNLPYELTCSFLLTADKPGVPQPIKLQEQHKIFFPLDRPITEESGRLIAAWAAGGKPEKPRKTPVETKKLDFATSGKEDAKKVAQDKPSDAQGGKNGHISALYPVDWEKVRAKVEKKLESAWKDLKEDTLGEFVQGRNENYRNFALNELRFRIVKFGDLYAGADQSEDFSGTTGGDIAEIPEQELAAVAKQLRSGWKKFTEKK